MYTSQNGSFGWEKAQFREKESDAG